MNRRRGARKKPLSDPSHIESNYAGKYKSDWPKHATDCPQAAASARIRPPRTGYLGGTHGWNSIRRVSCRDQPVSPPRNGLNDPGLVGVVTKYAAELGNRALKNIVRDEGVRPDSLKKFFFGNDLTCVLGQAHQNLHHLRLNSFAGTVLGDGVQAGLNQPGPLSEVAVHDLLQ